jgi:hypothetical protein
MDKRRKGEEEEMKYNKEELDTKKKQGKGRILKKNKRMMVKETKEQESKKDEMNENQDDLNTKEKYRNMRRLARY